MKTRKNGLGIVKAFYAGIMEIMDSPPNYSITPRIYTLIIGWHFLQVAGYLYSDEILTISNEYNKLVQKIEYVSTGTFLLLFKDSTNLTRFVDVSMTSILIILLCYLAFLTHKGYTDSTWISKHREKLGPLNRAWNSFFLLHQWVLFIPYCEIQVGTMFCGSYCFFSQHFEEDPCTISTLQVSFSAFGLILNTIVSMIIIVFFRNNEFNERNQLKRCYHWLLIPQFWLYFIVIYFTFSGEISKYLKYLCLQTVIISLLYDLVWNVPFRNPKLIQTYIIASVLFESTFFVYLPLIIQTNQNDEDMLYTVMILGSLISTLLLTIWSFRYDFIMKIDLNKFSKYYKYVDFYLEEIYRLSEESEKEQLPKYKTLQFIIMHQQRCNILLCPCSLIDTKKGQNSVKQSDVLSFIDFIFQWSLEQKILINDSTKWEHLAVKYITFSFKYRNNSVSSYYQLKSRLQSHKKSSFLFATLCNILASRIEMSIEEHITRDSLDENYASQGNSRSSLHDFTDQDHFQEIIVPLCADFLAEKVKFWNLLKQPSLSLDSLNQLAANLSEKCLQLIKIFRKVGTASSVTASVVSLADSQVNKFDNQNNNVSDTFNSAIALKVACIFKGLVLNQGGQARKIELMISDLLKRDDSTNPSALCSSKFISGNAVCVLLSLIYKHGYILNQKKTQILNFFGYEQTEESQINEMSQLMPTIFSDIHNSLMLNFIKRGKSTLFKDSYLTFGLSKQGFIMPIKIQIDYMSNYLDDFVLNGCILRFQTSSEFLILDEKGTIRGITAELNNQLFSQFQHLQKAATDKVFGDKYKGSQYFEVTNVLKISFILPQLMEMIKNKSEEQKESLQQEQLQLSNHSKTVNLKLHASEDFLIYQEKITFIVPTMLPQLLQSFAQAYQQVMSEKQQTESLQIEDFKMAKRNDDFNVQFKLFYLQNKVHWEYFKSRQYSATINVSEKILNYQQDGNTAESQKYYITEVLDIFPTKNVEADNENELKQSLSSRSKTLTKSVFQQQNTNHNNERFPSKFMTFETNPGSELKPNSSSHKTQTNASTLLPLSQNRQGSALILQQPQISTQGTLRKFKFLEENNNMFKSSFEVESPLNLVRKEMNEETNLTMSPQQSQALSPLSQDGINLTNRPFQIDQDPLFDTPSPINQENMNNSSNNEYSYLGIKTNFQFPLQKGEQHFNYQSLTVNSPNLLNLQTPPGQQQNSLSDAVGIISQQPNSNHSRDAILEENILGKETSRNNNDFMSKTNSDQVFFQQENSKKYKIQGSLGARSFLHKISKSRIGEEEEHFPSQLSSSYDENQTKPIDQIHRLNNHHEDYIQSQKQKSLFKDNELIQSIVQTKNPRILNPLKYLISKKLTTQFIKNKMIFKPIQKIILSHSYFHSIFLPSFPKMNKLFFRFALKQSKTDGRFLVLVSIVVIISVVILLKVNDLKSTISYSYNIGQLKMLISQQNIISLKERIMSLGIIDPTISNEYLAIVQQQMEEISVSFHDEHVKDLSLFSDLQQKQGDILQEIIIFAYEDHQAMQVKPIEFQFDTLNFILRVSQSQPQDKILSFYFLNTNFIQYSNLLSSFSIILADDLENANSALSDYYILFGGFIIGFFVFFLIFGVYFLVLISNYKKKVLLLFTRLTSSDLESELQILQTCETQLRDSKLRWMQVPFASFIAALYEKIQNQTSILGGKNKKSQHHKNPNSMIGSQLQGQKLNQYKTHLLVITVIQMCGVFFLVILILAYLSSVNLTQIISLVNSTSQFYESFNSALVISEMLTDSELIILSDPEYPSADQEYSTKILQNSISIVQAFSQNFISNVYELDSSLDSKKASLEDLFSTDICIQFSTEYICDPTNYELLTDEQVIIRTVLKSGISGVLSSYLQLFSSAQNILSQTDATTRQQSLNYFMNSSTTLALTLQAYDIPMKAITLFFLQVQECAEKKADDISSITFIYYVIFGVLLVSLQLIIDYKTKSWLKHSVQLLNLSLTFIPTQVAQNEASLQILKYIYRLL